MRELNSSETTIVSGGYNGNLLHDIGEAGITALGGTIMGGWIGATVGGKRGGNGGGILGVGSIGQLVGMICGGLMGMAGGATVGVVLGYDKGVKLVEDIIGDITNGSTGK